MSTIFKDSVVKIDDSLKKTAGLAVGNRQSGAGKATEGVKGTPSTPGASVSVQLSPQAQTLTEQVANASVFDTVKVEEIKAAIAEGRFQVNAEKVAEGLIDTVRDLLQSRKA